MRNRKEFYVYIIGGLQLNWDLERERKERNNTNRKNGIWVRSMSF